MFVPLGMYRVVAFLCRSEITRRVLVAGFRRKEPFALPWGENIYEPSSKELDNTFNMFLQL